MARETMRGAVYDVQTYLQLARIEAVSRNRPCRFLIDTDAKTIRVLDTMGTTGSTLDDETLYRADLPSSITFAKPTAGDAVTLANIGGTGQYEAQFSADGLVDSGTGDIHMFGGQQYGRISVYLAGGVHVERWTGSAWTAGS